MTPDDETLCAEMRSERRALVTLAYRLLGNLTVTEAVVQATYVDWYGLPSRDHAAIGTPRGRLMRILLRTCLAVLADPRRARRVPVGSDSESVRAGEKAGACFTVTGAEQRALRALHDLGAMSMMDIGDALGLPPESCQGALRDARPLTRDQRIAEVARDRVNSLLIAAIARRDLFGLKAMLDPLVVVRTGSDETLVHRRAPVLGASRVAQFLLRSTNEVPGTTVAAQETPSGRGFALWNDACMIGAGTIEITDGVVSLLRIDCGPRAPRAWRETRL